MPFDVGDKVVYPHHGACIVEKVEKREAFGKKIAHLGGNLQNPLTGQVEANGTSIIDVTDVKNPKFLFHIPGPPGPVAAAGGPLRGRPRRPPRPRRRPGRSGR